MKLRSIRLEILLRRLLSRVAACSLLLLMTSALTPRTALTQAPTPASSDPAEEALMPACKTDLRLSGSVYNAEHPLRSMAVFEVPSSHASAVYRLGSRVGSYELIAVVPRGVILRSSDGECWLRLVGDPHETPVAAKPKPQPSKAKRSRSSSKNKQAGAAVVIGSAR